MPPMTCPIASSLPMQSSRTGSSGSKSRCIGICSRPIFARLAVATPIPLAHGERELTRFSVRDFIVQGAIRYVQFDATRSAGFTEALRIAQLAEQHGVMLAPHTAPEIH